MKKIFLLVCMAFSLFITPCVHASEKMTVLLDWFANPDHAPLFVAKEQGFFTEQGLDVEMIGPADPSDPPKLVAAGKADLAITYQPQFLQQVAQGIPLVWVGTLINKPLNCLVVLKDGPIHTLADLKHKRIGNSISGENNVMLNVLLQKQGLKPEDVESLSIHYDLTQALLSGKVDAVTGMMRNFELIQMDLAGHPGVAFLPEENGLPTYNELIIVANKNAASPERIKHFMTALEKGVAYLKAHPEAAWQQFAKSHPELDNELNRRAWLATLPFFDNHPAQLNTREFMDFASFMRQNGLIKKVEPLSHYVTNKEST